MQSWTNTCLSPSLVVSIILLPGTEDAQASTDVDAGTEIPGTAPHCQRGSLVQLVTP